MFTSTLLQLNELASEHVIKVLCFTVNNEMLENNEQD